MPGVNRPAGEPRAGAGEGEGVLVLAATPIGRPEDAPPRLATELARADAVACAYDACCAGGVFSTRPLPRV